MNSDTYGAIKRDQQKIIDKYESIVAEMKTKLEAIVFKQGAIKICYETLKTIMDELPACPVCHCATYGLFGHFPGCELKEVLDTMREIVEG